MLPFRESPSFRKLLALLLFALLGVKVAATLARGPAPIELDALGYWQLSGLVNSGDVLMLGDPIAFRTPAYPWFLAVIRMLSSRPLMMIVAVQGALFLASILIAGRIAFRISGQPSAMIYTLIAALPGVSAITFAAEVLTETLFTFLLMLNLLAVTEYARHDTMGRLTWLAVTYTITLLTRPIVLLLWIPHVLFLVFNHYHSRSRPDEHDKPNQKKRSLRHRFGHAAIAAGMIAVMIAPWLARNHYIFGKPFLTAFVGRNVWVVSFQDGSGAGLSLPDTIAGNELDRRLAEVGDGENWRHTWTVSNALVASGLNDAEADQLMKRVCIDAMRESKKQVAYKAFRRCVNYWRCAATDLPKQGHHAGAFQGQQTWEADVPFIDWAIEHRFSKSVLGNTILTAVIGLATLLLVVHQPTRPFGIWIALVLAYFGTVTGILEIPSYRYRLVVEPIALMVIGASCSTLVSMCRGSK